MAGSIATLIIAELNKPEIVKPKTPRKARGGASSTRAGSLAPEHGFLIPPARGTDGRAGSTISYNSLTSLTQL